MTVFTILAATRRHSDLGERISAILHTVAPIVEETTSLCLPPEVRFRLVTPTMWRDEFRQNRERALARDVADLVDLPEEINRVRAALKVTSVVPVLVWPLMLAITVKAADGQSETIIAPRALHHGGVADEPLLHQVVAHELVHQLQAEARSGVVWRTYFARLREIRPNGVVAIAEGHAQWADQQVTERLFGEPTDHRTQARRSLRYRLHERTPRIRRLRPPRALYEQGARLIAHTVEVGGTDLVNRVWKDATLLPTDGEIADPDAWTDRLSGRQERIGTEQNGSGGQGCVHCGTTTGGCTDPNRHGLM
ncbi:zinc-dependent metalloprotease [Streptomyces sp. 2A115]|uniref:zinc-dependent metalloprotease n=1 Tax=Streptomyces sp. 2A115 TaxID=3457439 RepID=UPI003FD6BC30